MKNGIMPKKLTVSVNNLKAKESFIEANHIKKEELFDRGMQAFMQLRKEAKENGIQDMSLDEINEEIRKTRNGESE